MTQADLNRRGLTIAITDHERTAANAFKSSGFMPLRVISPAKFAGPSGSKLIDLVKSGECKYVHIHTPSLADIRPYEVAFWSQCTAFIQAASVASTMIAMHAIPKCKEPTESHQRFLRTHVDSGALKLSTHHWCHFGVSRHGAPSSNVLRLWSNYPLTDHLCRCDKGVKHQNSLALSDASDTNFRLTTEFSRRLLVYMASTMGLTAGSLAAVEPRKGEGVRGRRFGDPQSPNSASTPGPPAPGDLAPQHIPDSAVPTATYPTASKEAARNRRNELKAQGIDPKSLVKKRPKYIEPHFDDCGDDLSSISAEVHYASDT